LVSVEGGGVRSPVCGLRKATPRWIASVQQV
jgi:hypothetical protein